MAKKMLIETGIDEVRVAIVEGGLLVDYDIELRSDTTLKGNVYKGIITNVEKSLAAAFVDFGASKQGFLPFSEILPEALLDQANSDKPIEELLHRHQEIIVQVTRDEMGHKGAALTSFLSFAGRYCVLMYSDDGHGGVSRKIVDEKARKKAKDILAKLKIPEGLGVIVRTAGMDRTKTELQRDLSALTRTWKNVQKAAKVGRAPTLLYREPDIVVRTIRDYLLPDIEEIMIDDRDEFDDAVDFFNATMPRQKDLLSLYQDSTPLFVGHGVEEQISQTQQRKVRLPSGGEIVIDQTEALVAIDVNSARSTKEKDHEETVYKTNLEAAVEVARQLRLRDMGGIIVIDFIDHAQSKHDRAVEKALKDALKGDKAKTSVGRISNHGTLELTRQRLRRAHSLSGSSLCPVCGGSGRVLDPRTLAQTVLRELRRHAMLDPRNIERVSVQIDVDTANILLNEQREQISAIERSSAVKLSVLANAHAPLGDAQYTESKRNRRLSDLAYQSLLDQLSTHQQNHLPASPALANSRSAPLRDKPTSKTAPKAQTKTKGKTKAGHVTLPEKPSDDDNLRQDEPSSKNSAGSKKPNKTAEPGKRGGRSKKEKSSAAASDKTQSPAAMSTQKDAESAKPVLKPKHPASKSQDQQQNSKPKLVPVSEDPLTEALFGPGPISAEFAPDFAEHIDKEGATPKKKRRRRRRKPKSGANSDIAVPKNNAQSSSAKDLPVDTTKQNTQGAPGVAKQGASQNKTKPLQEEKKIVSE